MRYIVLETDPTREVVEIESQCGVSTKVFYVYKSQSEGMWRFSCIESKFEKLIYGKGIDYVTTTFIHEKLQIFIELNYKKLNKTTILTKDIMPKCDFLSYQDDWESFNNEKFKEPFNKITKSFNITEYKKTINEKKRKADIYLDKTSKLLNKIKEKYETDNNIDFTDLENYDKLNSVNDMLSINFEDELSTDFVSFDFSSSLKEEEEKRNKRNQVINDIENKFYTDAIIQNSINIINKTWSIN